MTASTINPTIPATGADIDSAPIRNNFAAACSDINNIYSLIGAISYGTMAAQNANNVTITGGLIDGTTIGASTPAAGHFTNLTASGTFTPASHSIAYASLPQVTARKLLGNATSGTTDMTEVALSSGLEFNGGFLDIAAGAVTNAMLHQVNNSTFKARITAGPGDPEDLTATQATSLLINFVGDSGAGGTKGLVPAPAAGDSAASKFLKADGSWHVPAGGGDVVGPSSATDHAIARFDTTTGQLIENSGVLIDDSNNISGVTQLTATTLVGALTGNSTSSDKVNHSLTAGTHLSGGSFDGSSSVTLSTDATNANTVSTIVSRDASGNFSAGTISAALNGNASTVTTNANLTGPITSVGNATSVASQTGTGTTFVMNTSPTLVAPALGTPISLVGTNITGTASGLTAGNVTTNANLTGVITSVGNATSIASQTGTGTKFVVDTSPTLVTPNIGVASGTSLALGGGTALATTNQTGTGSLVLATSPTITTASLGSSTATTQSPGDNSTKLATTAYVASAILGQDFKEACKYATTAALPTVVYANGSSGVGATLTGFAVGALSLDSQTPSVNDRVLVKNQASTLQNGIYTVTAVGSGIAVFVMTRATDFNQSFEINAGDSTFVSAGTTQATTTWAYNSTDAPTIGTDAITFAQTAGQGAFTAGNGISITGVSIAIDTSVTVDKTTAQTLTNKTLTSPIFTSPTLGTPASGVATNLTGTAASLTAGTATNAVNVATTQVSNSASYFPLMVSSSTNGNQAADLGTGLTFNPSTNNLSTTTFTGALVGNASTATSATSATTATTATNSTNTAITDDTSTNATMYPTWVTANTGNLPQKTTSTKLTYNPSTGALATTTFTGALSGNATTATDTASKTGTGSIYATNTSPVLVTPTLGVASATSLATSAASPLLMTNGKLVTVALTAQTVNPATITIPDFASVSDTFTFNTLAQTLSNKTFVTPALGTPASGVLTNCTGLPVAGQGTGISTYTTGDILYASATNVLSKLAKGNTNDVLTQGASIPSWVAPAAGSSQVVLLATATASTSASLSFLSVISSSYSSYLLVFNNLKSNSSAARLVIRTSENNSTFDSTSAHYASTTILYTQGSTGQTIAVGSVTTGICLTTNGQNDVGCSGWVQFTQGSDGGVASTSARAAFYGTLFFGGTSGGGNMNFTQSFGQNVSGTGVVNAIQIIDTGDTLASGTVYLYGIKNT